MPPYNYVGPERIKNEVRGQAPGVAVTSVAGILQWLKGSERSPGIGAEITATFVVDLGGHLRLADRRSEHVACAGGQPVLSAGEITFMLEDDGVRVTSVTNQSTGYCPAPSSWTHVGEALRRIGVEDPGGFTTEFIFRRCPACRELNLVKDAWFVCALCEADLPPTWNV